MPSAVKKAAAALVGVAALAVGGSAIANAASSGSTTTTATSTPPAPMPGFPAHGSASHEDAEKPVTGANADKAKAAAVESLGGGTAGDVTTDFTQNGYEVTVTKSDGSQVEVHLDGSFNVMRHGPGGHGGPPPASPPTFG
jgi:hypothetical protein